MCRTALIVAGGKGLRMGSELPKQFLPIGGKPVLMRTLEAFHRFDEIIIFYESYIVNVNFVKSMALILNIRLPMEVKHVSIRSRMDWLL